MDDFFQSPPVLDNQYNSDRVLRYYLQWKLPALVRNEIEPDLLRMGERARTDIFALGLAAEHAPPQHIAYDPWGKRVDRIEVAQAWRDLDKIAAEEGLISIAYAKKHGRYSRIHQFALLYLFHPSSAIYTCPLAMTDGAARAIELYGDAALKQHALKHLTSNDPEQFWTSGQWMTERAGGSDVSGTSTVAIPDGEYFNLHGVKWFTSATTSQMAMTLARLPDALPGSQGLSLFYLELRHSSGELNGISINRLKNKLGTKALPTAELTLAGAKAQLVGAAGDGVKKISSLFNITRIYNACSAVGYMRRAIALARDYATKRKAFGRLLAEHDLHCDTLAGMQVEFEAGFHLAFHAIELLGKDENNEASSKDKAILRLLTPLAKLYTAKQAIAVVSEALEAFGGAGYIEDTGLPRLLRDVQVLSIWEGTTNVLSLDVLRAINKEQAAEPFLTDIELRLTGVYAHELLPAKERVIQAHGELIHYLQLVSSMNANEQQMIARCFAFSLAQVFIASLLLEHAQWSIDNNNNAAAIVTAKRWCERQLIQRINPDKSYRDECRVLGLDL